MPLEKVRELITVNTASQALLTRVLVPHMLGQPGRTAIINISSIASHGSPFLSLYAATKAFNNSLNNALASEYCHRIDCLSLTPSFVASKMTTDVKSFWKI